jgi:hypothetical protein
MVKAADKRDSTRSGLRESEEHKQEAKLPTLFLIQAWLYLVCVRCVCCCAPRKRKAETPYIPLKEAKVLLIGLDGAGKSSFLMRMKVSTLACST